MTQTIMNKDQLLQYSKTLISEADSLVKSQPQKAKELYTSASELMIALSNDSVQVTQKEMYMKIAEDLIKVAESLENEPRIKPITTKSNISFSDVMGLDPVKKKIRLKIIEPFINAEFYKYYGKKVGGGILMYGPPGCGKTMLAEAAANDAGVAFLTGSASNLKSKFVGETEQNITALFNEARAHEPSIIFFDELDALGMERSIAEPHTKSAVSQLLTEINGLGNKDQKILLIGATNEPWHVDIALRRSGRFGTAIFIPPPDLKARYGIVKKFFIKKPLAKDVNLLALSVEMEGFSGADVIDVCEEVIENVISSSIIAKKKRKINLDDFTEVLNHKKPTIIEWFKKALDYVAKTNSEDFFSELVEFGEKYLGKLEGKPCNLSYIY